MARRTVTHRCPTCVRIVGDMAAVELVVTDLDGTLWDDTATTHPSTLAASADIVGHTRTRDDRTFDGS